MSRFSRAELDPELGWTDVLGLSLLGGIGFTVSLLISELAFGSGTAADERAKVGILAGTLAAALLAAVILRLRNRQYARIEAAEQRDDDHDGIPDLFEHGAITAGEGGSGSTR